MDGQCPGFPIVFRPDRCIGIGNHPHIKTIKSSTINGATGLKSNGVTVNNEISFCGITGIASGNDSTVTNGQGHGIAGTASCVKFGGVIINGIFHILSRGSTVVFNMNCENFCDVVIDRCSRTC